MKTTKSHEEILDPRESVACAFTRMRRFLGVVAGVAAASTACVGLPADESTESSTTAMRWSPDRYTLSDASASNGVHFGDAYWMARFSDLAYETPDRIQEELSRVGANGEVAFFTNPATGTQAFFLGTSTHIVLAFRGTEARRADLATDLRRSRRSTIFGKVHAGFHEAFESVWLDDRGLRIAGTARPREGLWSFLQRRSSAWPSARKLFVTGHSLGGALATLASVYISFARCSELYAGEFVPQPYAALVACRRQPSRNGGASFLTVDAVHTFGSPRVGDKDFALLAGGLGSLDRRVFRFTHGFDAVPKLPYFGYWHPLFLGSDDEKQIEVALGQQVRPLFALRTGPAAWQAVHDHGIARYRAAVLRHVAPDLDVPDPPAPDGAKARRYALAYADELPPSDVTPVDLSAAPPLLRDFLARIPSEPDQRVDAVEFRIDDEVARAIRVHRSDGADQLELAFLFDATRLVVTMGFSTDAQGHRTAFVVDASQPSIR